MFKSKLKKNKFSIVIEVNSYVYSQLIIKKKINISIGEDFRVIRCFSCCAYGHKANKCKEEVRCQLCSLRHTMSACESKDRKCANCGAANALRLRK